MNKLITFARITTFLASLSVLAVVALFLALADIADGSGPGSPEWYTAGISLIILALFTVSTIATIGLFWKYGTIKREH